PLIPELRDGILPVIPIAAHTDKRVRASRVEPILESGLFYLPETAPWLDDFKRELLAFPAGHNDDQVDAVVYALTRLRGDSDVHRNYLNWLSTTSPNAQKQLVDGERIVSIWDDRSGSARCIARIREVRMSSAQPIATRRGCNLVSAATAAGIATIC